MDDTVDGRNPAPVDMVNIPLFARFFSSQVVQDFFYQQYDMICRILMMFDSILCRYKKLTPTAIINMIKYQSSVIDESEMSSYKIPCEFQMLLGLFLTLMKSK